MLHKSKLMLPVLAVIVGVAASAFTTINQQIPSATTNDQSYYWFDAADLSGTGFYDQATKTVEISHQTCPNTGTTACEKAYLGDQLNVTDDPSSGVKNNETDQDQINRAQ